MYLKFLAAFFLCLIYCLVQSKAGECDLGHPANLTFLAPRNCCRLKHIYDSAIEAKCLRRYQNISSNVNVGIKGQFDGLECFFACLFNGTGIFKNKVVNVPALKASAAKALKNDNTWIPVVNAAIDFCNSQLIQNSAALSQSMVNKVVDNVKNCSPDEEFLGSCIYFYQIRNCPAAATVNGNQRGCTILREYYKKCPVLSMYKPN